MLLLLYVIVLTVIVKLLQQPVHQIVMERNVVVMGVEEHVEHVAHEKYVILLNFNV